MLDYAQIGINSQPDSVPLSPSQPLQAKPDFGSIGETNAVHRPALFGVVGRGIDGPQNSECLTVTLGMLVILRCKGARLSRAGMLNVIRHFPITDFAGPPGRRRQQTAPDLRTNCARADGHRLRRTQAR